MSAFWNRVIAVIRGLGARAPRLSRAHEAALLTVLASLFITAVLVHFDLHAIEASLYDLRVRHGWQAKPGSEIVLVTIDDATLAARQELSPLGLRSHAEFLEALSSYRPRAIGYLADLGRASQLETSEERTQDSDRILRAGAALAARSIPLVVGTPFDVTGEVVPPYPLSTLPHGLALIHKDGNVFAGDKVTRRALTTLYDRPGFHALLAGHAGIGPRGSLPRGNFEIPGIGARYFYFRYHGDPSLPRQAPDSKFAYTTIRFEDLAAGRTNPAILEGRVLLVGTVVREDPSDFAFTPYSNEPFRTPKLAIHANILDSMIRDDGLVRLPDWTTSLSTFAASAAVIAWVMRSSPLAGVAASFAMTAILWIASTLLFGGWAGAHGIWMETAHPSLGILLSYYVAVPYRLIREYRKRWEYQRRNQILVQVEELKTNFLSLVTHDLKTPVARIQGLAEVLLRRPSAGMDEAGRENLRHIIGSTEELNRFITSILELARIESSRLMPRLESKDVNRLVESCAETFATAARAKDTRIELDLEPLFPIRIDPSLIQKVLHNLVDNAIKYSPTRSVVRLETRDLGDWVEIHVRDQGIGLTDSERENLFQKFFRAKNETTASVGGSGLGLYLSRYFVEAHSGELRVASTPGEGSTFTIRLRTQPLAPSVRQGSAPGLLISTTDKSIPAQGEPS